MRLGTLHGSGEQRPESGPVGGIERLEHVILDVLLGVFGAIDRFTTGFGDLDTVPSTVAGIAAPGDVSSPMISRPARDDCSQGSPTPPCVVGSYASAANTIIGPVVDQADIFPDLANTMFQDNADEVIHRFIS